MNQAPAAQAAPAPFGAAISGFKPNPFDGSYNSSRAWIRYFLRFAQFSQLDDPQKCSIFPLLLAEGGPQLWFEGLPQATKIAWPLLLGAFQLQYITGDHVAIQQRLANFTNQIQRPNENIQEFFDRMLEGFQGLNFDLPTQTSFIIRNLRSEFRSIALMSLPINNLNTMLQKLKSAELSFTMDRELLPQANVINPPPLANAVGAPPVDTTGLAARIDSLEQSLCAFGLNERPDTRPRYSPRQFNNAPRPQWGSATQMRCFSCGIPGHSFRECRRRNPPPPQRGMFRGGRGGGRSFDRRPIPFNRYEGQQYQRPILGRNNFRSEGPRDIPQRSFQSRRQGPTGPPRGRPLN